MTGRDTGHGSGLWPVLLALLIFLIPTACVLWFLNEAVRNERLAAKQRLADAYRGYLPMLRDRLQTYWQQQAAALDAAAAESPGPAAFAACVGRRLADSVACYDSSGRLAYPAPARVSPLPLGEGQEARAADQSDDGVWADARRLEYVAVNPAAAGDAYGEIARKTADDSLAARVLQAQARCLARAGRTDQAVSVLADTLGKTKYARTVDSAGRVIAADAQLRALELIGDRTSPRFAPIADRLTQRLNDYGESFMPAAQRRFLMKEVLRVYGDCPNFRGEAGENGTVSFCPRFPTLEAEELAAAYIETNPRSADGALRPSGLAGVWRLASPGGGVVALLRTSSVLKRTADFVFTDVLPANVRVGVVPPETEPAENVAHSLPAGPKMPGWRLTLAIADDDRPDAVADRQVAVYVWIAVLVIAAMSIGALLAAAALHRQMRLTRLKNDLLATVSHELKTPLSSMRLLVDTLLDAETPDVAKTRDYLRLMAAENVRLSRLIDNFLSFSRMERGKQTFEFVEVSAAEIVRRAVEAAGERFRSPECRLEVETAADLPTLTADADALVTALLNLLDNAYKYSGDCKHIALRAYVENGCVCFAVGDDGIGLSPRAAKKAFRPFYQADRRLSRGVGGCGLGLSIVRSIVAAHGGTVRVDSRPGQGSTFTIVIMP
jgi:signal transduction histidine kinase